MKIGIDISQIAFRGTGVAKYTKKLVENLLKIDKKNEYILFFTSLRRKMPRLNLPGDGKVEIKRFKIPLTLLDFLWNKLHIFPIEQFIGRVDVFLSSDWTQPPSKNARLVTVVHDLSPWKRPETFDQKIIKVHKRKMRWVKKECKLVICDCEATKKDLIKILGIEKKKIRVIYPGIEPAALFSDIKS